MMMGTVHIFNIGYVYLRGSLGQISALQGAKSLYGTLVEELVLRIYIVRKIPRDY